MILGGLALGAFMAAGSLPASGLLVAGFFLSIVLLVIHKFSQRNNSLLSQAGEVAGILFAAHTIKFVHSVVGDLVVNVVVN